MDITTEELIDALRQQISELHLQLTIMGLRNNKAEKALAETEGVAADIADMKEPVAK